MPERRGEGEQKWW